MFMEQYAEQWNAPYFPAPGTYKEYVKRASTKEVEGVPKATDMIRHLVAAQEATARTARKLFPVIGKADDQPTADLLTNAWKCTRRRRGCCAACLRPALSHS